MALSSSAEPMIFLWIETEYWVVVLFEISGVLVDLIVAGFSQQEFSRPRLLRGLERSFREASWQCPGPILETALNLCNIEDPG